jgi:hypothetical protein
MSLVGCRGVFFVLIVSALIVAGQRPHTLGCAAIGPKGTTVQIQDEDAIIVYDAAKKTQHFIRRASFRAPPPNFGFLVPTPSVPKLTEVEDAAFGILSRHILPKVREVSGGWEFDSWFFKPGESVLSGAKSDVKSAVKKDVEVLDEVKVGGLHAVVLAADDPTKLEEWLKKNDYPTTPELTGWLGPYLAEKWKITAFKIERDPKSGAAVVSTKAVKMSFATDRPFFPYREPEVKPQKGAKDEDDDDMPSRALRVFFLGNGRMEGKLGNAAWHAEPIWANEIDSSLTETLAKELAIPMDEFPKTPWLTAFKDMASPRPATAEVFFEKSADQKATVPEDIIVTRPPTVIPFELIFLAVIVLGAALYLVARKMTRASR